MFFKTKSMGNKTAIQWTDATWNVARGCSKVDEDCKFCYMFRDSFNGTRYDPRTVVKTKTVFDMPLKWKKEKSDCWEFEPLIFTSSLTDFFHPSIDTYRKYAWSIIKQCPQYIFQILTKRPERIMDCLPEDWGDGYKNVWLGTSVGSNKGRHRIEQLIGVPAHLHFVSFEPLWEQVDLNFDISTLIKINWAILGGESGHESGLYRYRPAKVEWFENMIQQLQVTGANIFVKQLGTHLSKELHMTDRHGGNIDEFPESLRLREFPVVWK